jgi:hypothetical protein
MASHDPPPGQRFSHVYLERGEPRQESKRMRLRLAALIVSFQDLHHEFGLAVTRELGIPVTYTGYGVYDWRGLLEECETRDVLDLITIAYRVLEGKTRTGIKDIKAPSRWVTESARILSEENLHYRVDERGGVHFSFDADFARSRAAAIASLQTPRYANALHAFEGGMAAFAQAPPDGKGAIRGVFSAAESVFKLILPKAPRLGAAEADGLAPLLQGLYAQDETALRSTTKMLNGLKDWVDAAHFYRHEERRAAEVAQPPLRLAVYIVSTGASHLRWLAELDTSLQH